MDDTLVFSIKWAAEKIVAAAKAADSAGTVESAVKLRDVLKVEGLQLHWLSLQFEDGVWADALAGMQSVPPEVTA
jgi:hypothetical protein